MLLGGDVVHELPLWDYPGREVGVHGGGGDAIVFLPGGGIFRVAGSAAGVLDMAALHISAEVSLRGGHAQRVRRSAAVLCAGKADI